MTTVKTFQDIFSDYLLTKPQRARYWQKYKNRWWRLCGTYSYKGKRELVLAAYEKRRKKYGKRQLERMLDMPNPLLKLIQKDGDWQGGSIIVPFKR